jgi:hypothetical protein
LGDFLAVLGEERTHFQAGYVGDYDLHLSLSSLYGSQQPRLLAQPFETRLRLTQETKKVDNKPFSVKNGQVALGKKQPSSPTSPPSDDDDLIFGLD